MLGGTNMYMKNYQPIGYKLISLTLNLSNQRVYIHQYNTIIHLTNSQACRKPQEAMIFELEDITFIGHHVGPCLQPHCFINEQIHNVDLSYTITMCVPTHLIYSCITAD